MTRITAVETPKENPFLNCKLAREPYAKVLTDIVRTNSDGFVLAIDNKWGAGKTTFISMWKQHLENEEFQTLYFNAWENDFENNPFIALTAELKVLLKGESSDTFKEILKKGSKIAQATIPSIIKSVVKKYAGEDAAL
jgi:predicted AAA+ superfamily ATPase